MKDVSVHDIFAGALAVVIWVGIFALNVLDKPVTTEMWSAATGMLLWLARGAVSPK